MLTAFSVIILPLTLIASLWGMNVGVPGEGDPGDFWLIVGGMTALLVGDDLLLPPAGLALTDSGRVANQRIWAPWRLAT